MTIDFTLLDQQFANNIPIIDETPSDTYEIPKEPITNIITQEMSNKPMGVNVTYTDEDIEDIR